VVADELDEMVDLFFSSTVQKQLLQLLPLEVLEVQAE
jgi:hypothetical protein